ncbi:MAG: hypothetical protein IKM20_03130 [Erysipelotrichales bacterium]|nr:hypothetical protein [Erysipelotrichales bacterium]
MANQDKIIGFNIYKDKKRRDVYYDVFTKQGYIITKADINKLNFYQKRFILPVIVFSLVYTLDLYNLNFGIVGASAAAFICFICMEYFFHFRFLKTLVTLPNFVPDKDEGYFHQMAAKSPLTSLIIKGILYIALGALLVVFGIQENFQSFEWAICIIITVVVIIVGCSQLYAAYIKHSTKVVN